MRFYTAVAERKSTPRTYQALQRLYRKMAPGAGFEPAYDHINSMVPFQLGYPGIKMERLAGIEPATPSLARKGSTTELQAHVKWRNRWDLNPLMS